MPEIEQERRTLGRYELLFVLGQGGMGEVHLARLSGAGGFEKLCIVKTILPQMKAEPQFVERFHHEARVLTHLTHSNIAQVHDMGESEGTLFMAIEYVPGVDLARVETRCATTGNFLPVPIALHVGRLMCEALGYAHRKTSPEGTPLGIVHRDVSPQNVMVSYEGEVKVIDFGLAKSATRSKHTMAGSVMGKLGYMSPEQAVARPVDHRSDIYSAGIVIWEMLAGRPLFSGGTMAEMVAMMANPTVPSIRSFRPEVSETLEAAVLRALQKDPAARYNRADEFARALNEISVREGLSISAEETGNFVRAMCPEEFAAERQLQSQLSMLRRGGAPRPPSSPGHHLKPKSGTVSSQEEAIDGTFVRESSSPAMTPAQRALSVVAPSKPGPPVQSRPGSQPARQPSQPARATPQPAGEQANDELEFVPPRRSPAPFIALGVVLLLAAGGGAWALLGRDPPPPPKDPVAVVPPRPIEPVKDVEPKPAEPKPAEPVAVTDAGAVAARERVAPKGTLFKVIRRSDGAFIDLERGQKLREGDRLRLVGETVDGPLREVFGQARVLELKARGTVAELLMEEDDSHPEQLFAFVDETVVDRPKVAKVNKPDAPTPTDPKPVDVKPADPKPADPRPPEPPLVKVDEPKPADPKPAPPPALPTLIGSVRIERNKNALFGMESAVRVMIDSRSPRGTGCDVHLPNGKHLILNLKPGDNLLSDLEKWRSDPRPDPNLANPAQAGNARNYALVECRDAAGYLPFPVMQK